MASLTLKTKPGAACSIDVEYGSGQSTAAGLGDKKASSSGYVTWKWKIGGQTEKGTWPIYLSCSLKGADGQATSSVTVR